VFRSITGFHDLFQNGLKRSPGILLEELAGPILNLGSGNAPIEGADNLDQPTWSAPHLDYKDRSVAVIHAYHFLEHLDGETVIAQLRECERVLMFGGVMYICVPLAGTELSYSTIDHKTWWTEESLPRLFEQIGWEVAGTWRLHVNYQIIAGVTPRNLCVLAQVVKS
jgi:hypothetical protein